MKHRQKNGEYVEIAEMDDEHLINTIKMLQRQARSGIQVIRGGASGPLADDVYCDMSIVRGKEALKVLNFCAYEKEAKKRGLEIPKYFMRPPELY